MTPERKSEPFLFRTTPTILRQLAEITTAEKKAKVVWFEEQVRKRHAQLVRSGKIKEEEEDDE